MMVFLNDRVVREEEAVVSVFDRGFLYGDGLFETIRVFNGKPFRWDQHGDRFRRGAEFLGIRLEASSSSLQEIARQLIDKNGASDSLLRMTLSRGAGIRGYSPRGATNPTLVMSTHPAPPGSDSELKQWRLSTSSFRLPAGEPLAQFKTCNKLAQILSRAEADAAGSDEALLVNTEGFFVEGSSSNLFWVKDERVLTPPLSGGILPGVTRAVVTELCRDLGLVAAEENVTGEALRSAQGVFLSMSSVGIAEAICLDNQALHQSGLSRKVHAAYWELLRRECG